MTTLIYDGDEVLYQACKGCEREVAFDSWHTIVSDFEEVQQTVRYKIGQAQRATDCDEVIIALSCPEFNYRKNLAASYKGHRKATRKPLAYFRGIEWLSSEYETHVKKGLEADDVMGLMARDVDWIVSSDKDMKTIPDVNIYSPFHDSKFGPHTQDEADNFWLYQTLIGDTVDGYAGCPRVGKVTAERMLAQFEGATLEEKWEVVVKAYTRAGKTEEDAILQARLARILRPGEYRDSHQKVLLWSPQG